MNPEGESRREKITRKERDNQTKMEENVKGMAPGEEGAEIQSPKRIAIRVEFEETQKYVR